MKLKKNTKILVSSLSWQRNRFISRHRNSIYKNAEEKDIYVFQNILLGLYRWGVVISGVLKNFP
jgi:hypothetical protein